VGNIINDIYNICILRINKMNFVDIYIKNDCQLKCQTLKNLTDILTYSDFKIIELENYKEKICITTPVSVLYHCDLLIICEMNIDLIKIDSVSIGYGKWCKEKHNFDDLYVELKKDAHFYKRFAEYNKAKIN
tara:strand:- start:420 stop:815 length:396 start_codon:yes stop_codon:yes gene_type:complete